MTATELEGGYKLEPTLYSDGGQEIRQLSLMSPISLALCHFSLFPLDSTSLLSRKNGCCQLIKTPKSYCGNFYFHIHTTRSREAEN